MSRLIAAFILGFSLAGTVALADPAPTGGTAAATASADDPDAIVCRPGEPVLGTRLPGPRVCHSQKEWDRIRLDAQAQVQHMKDGAGQSFGGGGK